MKKINKLVMGILLTSFSIGSVTATPLVPLLANVPVGIIFSFLPPGNAVISKYPGHFKHTSNFIFPFSLTMNYTVGGFSGDISEYRPQPGFSESLTITPPYGVTGQLQEFELVSHTPGKTPENMNGGATIPSFVITPTGQNADPTDTVTIPDIDIWVQDGYAGIENWSLVNSVKGDYECFVSDFSPTKTSTVISINCDDKE